MENYIPYQENYLNIEQALKDGARLHAFRSGGGLRVISVEKNEQLLSYGEYPWISGALAHAESDFGLSYIEQYSGKNARHIHYLTGASSPVLQDVIDCFILCGESIDIYYKDNQFICNTTTESERCKGYSGIGNDIIKAIHSCIQAKMLYSEFAKHG